MNRLFKDIEERLLNFAIKSSNLLVDEEFHTNRTKPYEHSDKAFKRLCNDPNYNMELTGLLEEYTNTYKYMANVICVKEELNEIADELNITIDEVGLLYAKELFDCKVFDLLCKKVLICQELNKYKNYLLGNNEDENWVDQIPSDNYLYLILKHNAISDFKLTKDIIEGVKIK